MNLNDQVDRHLEIVCRRGLSAPELMCDRHPEDSVALRVVDGELRERQVTFGELAARSRQVASVLSTLEVGPNDRVATLLGKNADLPAVILGILRLGAVYVPLFTAFASSAVEDRLRRASVKVVITEAEQVDKVPTAIYETLVVGAVPRDSGLSSFDSEVSAAIEWSGTTHAAAEIPIVHMFTSGTTGKPKAVVHPLSYMAGWLGYLEFGLGVDATDVYWNAADPGWAYGLYGGILAPLAAGLPSIIHTPKFEPKAALAVLTLLKVTNFAAAPTVYRALRSTGRVKEVPSLRRLSSAGEPLTEDVLDWASTEWGLLIHDHFGQTELGMCAGFAHHPDAAIDVTPSAMGQALPGWTLEALQLDADVAAPTGQIGRLALRVDDSPFYTFTGYGVDRDAAGDRITADGRFYVTGDLVSVDVDGVIHFRSREDDVILMAGYRIGPFDVESCLGAHPAVLECAVVAAPNEARGEVVHAFVVTRSRSHDLALERELQEWVKRNYSAHAYPRSFSFVDALPKTPSGKVQRDVLRVLVRDQEANL